MPRISVGVRIRPDGGPDGGKAPRRLDNLAISSDQRSVDFRVTETQHSFTFNRIFKEETTQAAMYEGSMRTLVEGALDGYNGCIFAYGQTGAGKTYTMSGNLDGDEDGYGLVPRTALELFRLARKATESNFSFRLSVLEIYNEVLFDLLVEQSDSIPAIAFNTSVATGGGDSAKDSKLTILELDSGVVVPNLRIMPITSAHDAIRLLQEAQANRAIAEHQLNQRSSRSHVIYTFYVTKSATPHHHPGGGASADSVVDPIVHQSKLHLVDLAGSERVNKTGSMGTVQKEANYINRSLSYLEQVVLALTQANRDHIPYRQSKLTHLVKDSLGGNCQTVLVACVWPRRDHAWETLSTMRFAARMKNVETNPVRNRLVSQDSGGGGNGQGYVNGGQLRTLQLQVESLKRELALRDFIHRQDRRQLLRLSSDAAAPTAAAADDLWLPDLTKLQRQQTSRNLLRYVLPATGDDGDRDEAAEPLPFAAAEDAPPVEINALSQVHHYLAVMKRALFIACGYDDQRLREALVQAVACVHLSQPVPSGLDALQALAAEALAPVETASNTPLKDATGGGPKVLVGGARRGEERFIGEVLHIAGVAAQAPPAARPAPEVDVDAEALPMTSRTQKQTPTKVAPAASSVLSPDADSQLVGSAQRAKKEELFRQFTAAEGAGRDWQRAYDDACDALKNAKLRQREIVAYLNSNKADIDRLAAETQQLVERLQTRDAVDEGDGDGDGVDEAGAGELSEAERQQLDAELRDSRAKLDEVKRTYRAAYQEMQICKEQIEEMHSLKKRAMTALLTAFDAHYRKLYRAAGDDGDDGGSGGDMGDGDGG